MALRSFLERADRRQVRMMVGLSVLSGIANAALVFAVNEVAELVAEGTRPGWREIAIYLTAFVIFYYGNKLSLLKGTRIIERLLRDLRIEIMDRVRRSELRTVERLGRHSLYTLVSEQTNNLSLSFPMLIQCVQQGVLMAMALVYLAWLSLPALGVFFGVSALAWFGYKLLQDRIQDQAYVLFRRQARFVDAMQPFLDGAKELRLNQARNDDVFEALRRRSAALRRVLLSLGEDWTTLMLMGNAVTFGILGIIIFTFPGNFAGYGTIVFQLVPVLLFTLGPLTRIAIQGPLFVQADAGLGAVLDVREHLADDGAIGPEAARQAAERFRDFGTIALDGLSFSHRDAAGEAGFTVGPVDLQLRRGEVVFLTGGNGSGKSTILHLLCGLYPADKGSIRVDGVPVTGRKAVAGFRELFSGVFVDFHLFDRLYGLEHLDEVEVNRLIADFGLADKVVFEDGRFSTVTLSTGQRKRMALIVAMLEDRPILVLDEWSAEQDVQFRDRFYSEIIPRLKAEGRTVIAITHDDRYWPSADRVIKLDLGRVVADERPG